MYMFWTYFFYQCDHLMRFQFVYYNNYKKCLNKNTANMYYVKPHISRHSRPITFEISKALGRRQAAVSREHTQRWSPAWWKTGWRYRYREQELIYKTAYFRAERWSGGQASRAWIVSRTQSDFSFLRTGDVSSSFRWCPPPECACGLN